MEKTACIFVAGAQTFIGNAIQHALTLQSYQNVVTESDAALDLTRHDDVEAFFKANRPEFVFCAAGKSGGIAANMKYPADFMLDNVLSTTHVLDCAHRYAVKKLLYLASACCYPRHCPQPMKPDALFQGAVEPTNEAYAMAKRAGIALCQAYRQQYECPFVVGIPANPFGPGDHFDPENSHVVAALILKLHAGRQHKTPAVTLWGSGQPRRDFIYIDDLAQGCLFVMEHYDGSDPINIGGMTDISIAELAEAIRKTVGYIGNIVFDTSHPDGMPIKCLDTSPLQALGWKPSTSIQEGLAKTYQWYSTRKTAPATGGAMPSTR